MTVLKIARVGAEIVAMTPVVVAGVVWDEIRWRRMPVSRVPWEPGMREWIADTCGEIGRVRRSFRG